MGAWLDRVIADRERTRRRRSHLRAVARPRTKTGRSHTTRRACSSRPCSSPAASRPPTSSATPRLLSLRIPTCSRGCASLPNVISAVVEESLRHDTPVQMMFRTATGDVEIAGSLIPPGRPWSRSSGRRTATQRVRRPRSVRRHAGADRARLVRLRRALLPRRGPRPPRSNGRPRRAVGGASRLEPAGASARTYLLTGVPRAGAVRRSDIAESRTRQTNDGRSPTLRPRAEHSPPGRRNADPQPLVPRAGAGRRGRRRRRGGGLRPALRRERAARSRPDHPGFVLHHSGRPDVPGHDVCRYPREDAALAPMVDAVHAEGASIFVQLGHGGLFAMEAWHEPYASQRAGPLLAASRPPLLLRPTFRGVPVHVLTTDEVHALAPSVRRGRGMGARSRLRRRAARLGQRQAAGPIPLAVLQPSHRRVRRERREARVDSSAHPARGRRARGRRLSLQREGPGRDGSARVPAHEGQGRARVEPPGRGVGLRRDHARRRLGVPRHDALARWRARLLLDEQGHGRTAAASRTVAAPAHDHQGGRMVGRQAGAVPPRMEPRPVHRGDAPGRYPVFAVGGIRTADEVHEILDSGAADMVGIGRPFYAEPDLRRRILDGDGRARPVPELEPVCRRADARHERRLLQPRSSPRSARDEETSR